MNFRLTAVLFLGVVVLVAALLVTAVTDDDASKTDGGLVPALAGGGGKDKDVDTVELVRTQPTEEKLVFVKANGKWTLKEPHPAKADGYQIDRLVSDLFLAKPVPHPELSLNLSNHGLAPATVRVTLKAGDKTATVSIGNTTMGGDKAVTYAATSDRPDHPVAVRRSDLTGLFRDGTRTETGEAAKSVRWLGDFRDRRVLVGEVRDPSADLAGLKLSAGGKELALTHKPGGPWTFAAPAGYGDADLNGASEPTPDVYTGVRPLLTAVATLQANGPDDFIEKPEDLAKYGLNPGNPNLVRVELTPATGTPEVLYLGGKVEVEGKPTMPAKVYARVEGDPAVVKLATDKVDALRNTVSRPGELLNKDLLAENLRDRIDAIDVTANGATTKLRKVPAGAEKKWFLYGGPGDPQPANPAVVQNLIAALTKPRTATDVLAAPYDAAFDPAKQSATLKLWAGGVTAAKADGDKPPAAEPAPTGTPIELVFGLKDAAAVLVRRTADGKKTDLKAPDAVLAAAAKPRIDYLEAALKPFDPDAGTKLVLKGQTEKVVLLKNGDKWVYEEPAAKKGKTADAERVAGLRMVLAGLHPSRVLAVQPTPDDLKRLGLTPENPRVRAVVGLKDGGEAVYEFGTETDDKMYVAARQAGGPLVIAVPKVNADRLLTEDLRDRTIYRIDPEKVVGLKVRGWKPAAGTFQTVEFEKKGAEWTAKTPPTPAGFTPDPLKLNALLTELSAPRVDEFIGQSKPEYGLSVEQNPDALEFTVINAAPAPAVTLVLGAKTPAGTRVYAASSAIPGEIATFNPAAIKPLTEKPETLKK